MPPPPYWNGAPLPCIEARIALRRDGPPAPHALTVGGFVSSHESANPPIPPGDTRNDHIVHDQRRHGGAVMLRFIRHHHVPQQLARDAVQSYQMGVIRSHEYLVAQEGDTAIGA